MSHPDPLFDPDNAYEDDVNYNDYNDFYDDADQKMERNWDDVSADDLEDNWDENDEETEDDWDDEIDDSMDGDAESAFGSCGWGVDEYYEHYESGDDY
jgi:hypothetical protein